MISSWHQSLLNRSLAYHRWHERPEHKFWHWFLLFVACVLSLVSISHYSSPTDIGEQTLTSAVHAAQTIRHNYTIQSCYGGTNANNTCTSDTDCSGGVCLNPVVAWWNLDEPSGTRYATGGSCGADCNLSDVNTVSQDATNKMEGSGAASFSIANGEYLECSDATCGGIGKLDFNSNLTMACWARRTSGGGVRNIFQKLSGSPSNGYRFQLLSGGQLQYGLYNAGSGCSTNGQSSAPVDTWHHWGIAFNDIAKTVQMYFDGKTEGSALACPTGIGDSTRNFSISQSGTSQSMDGQLDECFAANQAYTNQQVCEICRFGLDGEESDRGAQCGSCDPGPAVSPPSSDTTPPVLSNGSPTSQLPADTTQTTMQVTTNENATCKYSTTAGVSYASMSDTFSTTGSTSHSTLITGLSDGQSYTYYIRCQDTASTPNANPDDYPISFSVAAPAGDTTPPTVSITTPANNSTVSGNATITANASDNVGVTGVTFFYDLVNQIADILTAPFTTLWNTTTVPDGPYTLTATARDAAGNTAISASVGVTVNNGPPPAGNVYYVDPVTGNNANNGTSPSTPWQNPPGTRNIADTGFYSSTWGSISTTNKIKCGDTIYLKGGATQTSAEGGAWDFDSIYYTNTCTTGSRITLKVATNAEWAGAGGHFTLDATNVVPAVAGTGCDWPGIVAIHQLSFFQILGRSDTARFRVTHGLTPHTFIVPACWASSFNPTGVVAVGNPHQGLRLDWIEITDTYFGMQVGQYNNWQVSNIVVSGVKSGGLLTGLAADLKNDGGAYVNATVHDSGCGSSAFPDCIDDNRGQEDGFSFTGHVNMWCVNCTSYNNGERGFSGGVIRDWRMTSDYVAHWRNLVAYSNGLRCGGDETGNGNQCSSVGFMPSGSDWYNDALSRNYVVGLISWGHKYGGASAYGGAHAEVWHADTYYNGYSSWGGSEHGLLTDDRYQGLINSIIQQYSTTRGAYSGGDSSGGTLPRGTFTPGAYNNCYRPFSSDNQTLGASLAWNYNQLCTGSQTPYSCCTGLDTGTCNGTGWPGLGTYASPPSWIGATNKVGLAACDPKFTALSTTSFAANDFTLQADSTATDAGRFLMLANGAGSNATTLTVQANGGGSDPRYYFISPVSYLDAVADTIQIKDAVCQNAEAELGSAERAKIVSMTATAMTLDRACTWSDNAGVHLPWEGSAPDMGAYEYVGGSPPPPTSFDFSLGNSGNLSVSQGSSAQSTITATLTTGTPASLTFSASGLPVGATASFSPVSCSPNCSTTLTITTPASTPLGNSTITVTAIGGGTTKTTTFTLIISDTTPPTPGSITTANLTSSTVTISLTTNEAAVARLEYGVTSQLGQTTSWTTTPATAHELNLAGLTSATTYFYRVRVRDSANNESVSTITTFTTLPPPDTTAPAAASDLGLSSASATSLTLMWTAAGDDGNTGQAASYDLRFSTSPLTDTSFSQATRLTGLPTPKPAGGSETYTVIALTPSAAYYLALKSTDDANLTSAISNILQASTTAPPPSGGGGGGGGGYIPDTTPPASVAGLQVQAASGEALLTWTNPTDSDFVRTTIVRKLGTTAPASPTDGTLVYEGPATSFTDTGLTNGQSYSYALFTLDRAGNYSSAIGPSSGGVTPTAGTNTITSSLPAALQGLITADRLGGTPLVGATVTLKTPTTNLTIATDSQGKYPFQNLSPGTYTLTISQPNRRSHTTPSFVLTADENPTKDFYLMSLPTTPSDLALAKRLAGRILLHVQSKGEAWYVHPITLKRYYLGRPADAFRIMREHGLGITNVNLSRVPEASRSGALPRSLTHVSGRILLQVESHGEAWYVNPQILKRYYLGRPADAFRIMREQGLGITDKDLEKIGLGGY